MVGGSIFFLKIGIQAIEKEDSVLEPVKKVCLRKPTIIG